MKPHRPGSDVGAAALTERVNCHTGVIRASGELTGPGADLLSGTVDSLCRMGHGSVLLDLRDVSSADENGMAALCNVSRSVGGQGARLLIRTWSGIVDTTSEEAWPRIRQAWQ